MTPSSSSRPDRSPRLLTLLLASLALLALPASAALSAPHGRAHTHVIRRQHDQRGLDGRGGMHRRQGGGLVDLPDVVINAAPVPATSSSTTLVRTTATTSPARSTVATSTATTPDLATSDTSTDTADSTTAVATASSTAVVSSSSGLTSLRATGTITVIVNATGTSLSSSSIPANTSTLVVAPSSSSASSESSAQPTVLTSIDRGTTLVKTVTSLAPNSNSTLTNQTAASSGGLATGAIAAIAVVGGLVVLALAGFILWKIKRRNRFGGDYDDEDGIKWPELNKHGDGSTLHPLPARPTGGHGLETSALDRSETDLDGEPIGGHDADFDYAYPPHAASLRHDDGMGNAYYDHSPSIGGYDDPNAGASYLTLNRAGSGIASSEGPFDDPLQPDGREYEGSIGHQSLGGTQAFEAQPADGEMRMLGGPASMPGVGRSKSGRLL